MKLRHLFFLCCVLTLSLSCQEQTSVQELEIIKERSKGKLTAAYKKLNDTTSLQMDVYYPENFDESKTYPVIILFHGGGWQTGGPGQFFQHSKVYTAAGFVVVLPEYRLQNIHNATPFEALEDAKTVVRAVRSNGSLLHIDAKRIVVGGASAGGHLAAATAIIDGYNDSNDVIEIDPTPNALVLFNPVIDNGPDGYGYERIGPHFTSFSPIHNINQEAPPTIFFLGENDHHIPVATAVAFKEKMEDQGGICELHLYKNEGHGFFNYRRSKALFDDTNEKVISFLKAQNIL